MTKGGKLIEGIFKGETINTPSMLAVEDYIFALEWAELQGGLAALIARADANAAALDAWVAATPLDRASRRRSRRPAPTPASASNSPTSGAGLDEDGAARAGQEDGRRCSRRKARPIDIAGYRDAPPGLRIWCGATVETDDIEALGPWLDWAFHEARALTVIPAKAGTSASDTALHH